MHDDREGFEKRAFGEADVVGKFVAPFRWMALVSLDGAVVRVYACELYIFAEIVTSVPAEETFSTRNSGLDGYAITYNK